ncbi:MAG TPA: hypothetical protein VEZ90_14555, partial [Blastocatellia bacterium]|nr:hypothetical protein [Blastocatellia bacterium]
PSLANPLTGQEHQDRDPQKPLQHTVASQTASFGAVSKTDDIYKASLDCHQLAEAFKAVGQKGSFRGTISKVFEERDGDLIILDFDPDFKTALTAVVKNPDYPKFPDLRSLDGKEVVVSGVFVDYHGKAEIILTEPAQIKLVK